LAVNERAAEEAEFAFEVERALAVHGEASGRSNAPTLLGAGQSTFG
jgi:hypothetical protein